MLKTPGFLGKSSDDSNNRFAATKPAVTTTTSVPQQASSTTTPIKPAEPLAPGKSATTDDSPIANLGNRLIVGPDVKLKGAEIHDCDTLIVEGRVEATLDSRIIRVAEQGSFNGTVGVDTAEILGHFDGELTARGQLFIHSTGHVNGKIRYGKILIEEGGQISGDVQAIASSDATLFDSTSKPKPPLASLN